MRNVWRALDLLFDSKPVNCFFGAIQWFFDFMDWLCFDIVLGGISDFWHKHKVIFVMIGVVALFGLVTVGAFFIGGLELVVWLWVDVLFELLLILLEILSELEFEASLVAFLC